MEQNKGLPPEQQAFLDELRDTREADRSGTHPGTHSYDPRHPLPSHAGNPSAEATDQDIITEADKEMIEDGVEEPAPDRPASPSRRSPKAAEVKRQHAELLGYILDEEGNIVGKKPSDFKDF